MSRTPILSVASEIYPLIKTGGLADVVGALPGALAREGFAVRTLIPGYPAVLAALKTGDLLHRFPDLFGRPARLIAAQAGELGVFVLDAPHLFARPGNPYLAPNGKDWPDNPIRFAALARVGAAIGQGLIATFEPALVHCHDWQAGLVPAYLAYGDRPRPPTVFTIHNLAFQGTFPAALLDELGFPDAAFDVDGIEYHGQIGYLKSGIRLADRITTVSPTYASEICSSESGMGLEGLLRGRADVLKGILNGIDTSVWNPATDTLIPVRYDAATIDDRTANKRALQARFELEPDQTSPLFGVISRLGWQKGLDLLLTAIPVLLQEGAQLVLLGAGDAALEQAYREVALAHPGRIGCVIGYDEALAHLIQAGSDALIVPSRFEPCGLTQLCALRYGAVPLVARVGGLADTVIDANPVGIASGVATGVQFSPINEAMLESAIRRTTRLYRQPELWAQIQRNGMATDVSWAAPVREYAALYRELLAGNGGRA